MNGSELDGSWQLASATLVTVYRYEITGGDPLGRASN